MHRRIGAIFVVTAVMTATLIGGAFSPAGAVEPCADATTKGCWSAPFAENPLFAERPPNTVEESLASVTAVSAVVTPTGRIVYWNGLTSLEDSSAPLAMDGSRSAELDESRVLDLTGEGEPAFLGAPINSTGGGEDGLFCSDQRLMANGYVLSAGGTEWDSQVKNPTGEAPDIVAELYGSDESRLFDATGNSPGKWLAADERAGTQTAMKWRRWYPSLVTQPDGNLFIAGGVSKLLYNSNALDPRATDVVPRNVPESETYSPATDGWTANGDTKSLPLYARLHLLPSGEILYNGVGQMWAPAGEDVDELGWGNKATFNPTTKTWRTHDGGPLSFLDARSGAFSAALPLKAPFDQAQFLVAGGLTGPSPSTYLAEKKSFVVTAKDSDGDAANGWETSSEQVDDLNNARWYSSGVTLPNGEVLAFNGADKDEVIMPSIEDAVRQAELWNGSEWIALSSGARDRTYHNSALLLPDGSALVGGHSPINLFYGDKGNGDWDDQTGFANNLKDPSFERFYPPYLFKGARPDVSGLTRNKVHYGEKIEIALGAGNTVPISKIVLSRLPAVTHTTDADARTVELAHSTNGQNISVDVPLLPSVLPPGYYYVFALSDEGVPSEAAIVNINFDDDTDTEAAAIPAKPIHLGGLPTGGDAKPATGSVPEAALPATSAAAVALPVESRTGSLAAASALAAIMGAAVVAIARRRRVPA